MSIVFILLGALAGTLFLISKLGLDLPPQHLGGVEHLTPVAESREDLRLAA